MAQTNKNELDEQVENTCEEVKENGKEKTEKKSCRKDKLNEKELAEKNKKITELEEALKESEDKYLRMLAEYDNFRKRAQKEKETIYADAKAETVENLLTVLDNLERASAVDVANSDAQSVVDGVNNILKQASETFGKMGVEEIPALGEQFNPELHNAVMHEDNEDYGENTISDVFLKGYKLGDKVIRHSVVKVMN